MSIEPPPPHTHPSIYLLHTCSVCHSKLVAELETELCFTYGMLGFGFSSQVNYIPLPAFSFDFKKSNYGTILNKYVRSIIF